MPSITDLVVLGYSSDYFLLSTWSLAEAEDWFHGVSLFFLENLPIAVITLGEAVVLPVHVEALAKADAPPSAPFAHGACKVPGLFWAREIIVESRTV